MRDDASLVDRMVARMVEALMKLLGIEKPAKAEVSGKDGGASTLTHLVGAS